jgi:uncharacterized protein YceK
MLKEWQNLYLFIYFWSKCGSVRKELQSKHACRQSKAAGDLEDCRAQKRALRSNRLPTLPPAQLLPKDLLAYPWRGFILFIKGT